MISVIIVNFNGEKFIRRCIESLNHQTFKNYEVIVVDNASTDDSVPIIRDKFPWVNLVELPVNSGFAGGNVVGLRATRGEFIALLNSDAFPEPAWLSCLLEGMDSDASIGICASKLIIDGTDLIDSAGDGITSGLRGYKRGERKPKQQYDRMEKVFGACGGAALYRRTMIDEIGFFDEDFFLIYEDTDLNFRAQLAGWKCLYVPDAVVHHRVRSTIGESSDLAIYYSIRNPDFIWIKNTPVWLMFRYLHHKILFDISSFFYFGIRKRRLHVFLKAKIDALRLFPVMLKKRRVIQKAKRISNKELSKLLTSVWNKDYLTTKLRKIIKG